MPEEFEVFRPYDSNAAVVCNGATPPRPQGRMDAWYRDVTASAIAIARWEDDGGRPARLSISGASPRITGGRIPLGNRDT